MEISSIPHDQRVRVIVHEIISESNSFIDPSGYISFIQKRPEEVAKIESIDNKLRDEYQRISESPPMLHVQEGKALLAFFEDSFYRGFCLRVLALEADVWFADYGNIARVKKTDLRSLPKDYYSFPAASLLGRLNLPPTRLINGNVESQVMESFNRKILGVADRQADVIISGFSYAPFKICSLDIIIGDSESSFLTLLSNKLDWGFSPVGIERKPDPTLMTSPKTPITTIDQNSLNGHLPGSYPLSPDVQTSMSERSLSNNLSSLCLSEEKRAVRPLPSSSQCITERGPIADSAIKKELFVEKDHPGSIERQYPGTIEGCHQRIDQLEARLMAVEETLLSLCPTLSSAAPKPIPAFPTTTTTTTIYPVTADSNNHPDSH